MSALGLTMFLGESIEGFTPADKRRRRLLDVGGRVIGHSEQGREIIGVTAGRGPVRVSLVAGAHSDEPTGTETLLRLAENVCQHAAAAEVCTFVIVPHVNPDGEAANRTWIDAWPDPLAHLSERQREQPGRDVEFAYPDGRIENQAVSNFLREHGPYDLHLSLHGMSAATGAWHLIERSWVDRTADLCREYAAAVVAADLPLFDWDRGGEKGFHYIEPGFATTPTGRAMREHFRDQGDEPTAARFRDSSMEFVQSLGGDPLCMVTELPLWIVSGPLEETEAGVPHNFHAFREALQTMDLDGFSVQPAPIHVQSRLQMRAIELGIDTVQQVDRHTRTVTGS